MRMSSRAGVELHRPMSGEFENAVIPMSNMLDQKVVLVFLNIWHPFYFACSPTTLDTVCPKAVQRIWHASIREQLTN